MQSAGPFDMAIDGDGFFALRDAAGAPVYSRDGRFVRGGDGVLRNADGAALPGIKLGPDATNVSIDGAGNVFADTGDGKHRPMGKVTLAIFAAPQGLRSNGGTSFAATRASGAAKIVAPQSHGAGRIAFGMLEKSNVSIMEEMMEILSAQRAFEANSKGVEAADEIQRIANNINRGQ
jgi:flagellar basal-body rod protein FlgG